MLHDITEIKKLEGYKLHICFDDGTCGDINISDLIQFKGIFEPLKNKKFFDTATVNRDLGTIVWNNGADLAPEVLYKKIIANKTKTSS